VTVWAAGLVQETFAGPTSWWDWDDPIGLIGRVKNDRAGGATGRAGVVGSELADEPEKITGLMFLLSASSSTFISMPG